MRKGMISERRWSVWNGRDRFEVGSALVNVSLIISFD